MWRVGAPARGCKVVKYVTDGQSLLSTIIVVETIKTNQARVTRELLCNGRQRRGRTSELVRSLWTKIG